MTAKRTAPIPYLMFTAIVCALVCVLCVIGMRTARHTPPNSAPATSHSPIVFVGFGGITWASISEQNTPNLYAFAQESLTANLVDKTLDVTTCPNSGWLTINTGQRTQESESSQKLPCAAAPEVTAEGSIAAETWAQFSAANTPEKNGYVPDLGAFSSRLKTAGISARSVGSGGALALATAEGQSSFPYVPLEYHDGIATNAESAFESSDVLTNMADVTIIDLGTARTPGWELGGTQGTVKSRISAAFGVPDLDVAPIRSQAAAIDGQFGRILEALPRDTTVIAASLNEADSLTAQLQYFAMRTSNSEQMRPTRAYTNSTRHVGLVQTTDIPVTLLDQLGAWDSSASASEAMVGSPIMSDASTAASKNSAALSHENALEKDAVVSGLRDLNQRAILTRSAVGPYLVGFGVISLLYGAIVGLLFGLLKWRLHCPRMTAGIGLSIAAVPMCALLTNLIPWWRVTPGENGAVAVWCFFGLLCLISTGVGIVSLACAQRVHRALPVHFLAAVIVAIATTAVFITDAATGSTLHYTSVLGAQQPQDGSRFYGFANTAHITVALACVFIAGASAHYILHAYRQISHPRLWASLAVVGIGFGDLMANASSAIGADFGGTLGIVISFGILTLFFWRGKIHAWHIAAVCVGGFLATAAFALMDWLRPAESRTHIGNFVQSILHGQLGQILARKAALFAAAGSPLVWVLTVFPIIGLIWITSRAGREFLKNSCMSLRRTLLQGAVAGCVLTIISLSINDSGPLLPFLGAAFAIPLWLVASMPDIASYDTESRAVVTSQ